MELSDKQKEKITTYIEKIQDRIDFEVEELSDYLIQVFTSNELGDVNASDYKSKLIELLTEFFKDDTEQVITELLIELKQSEEADSENEEDNMKKKRSNNEDEDDDLSDNDSYKRNNDNDSNSRLSSLENSDDEDNNQHKERNWRHRRNSNASNNSNDSNSAQKKRNQNNNNMYNMNNMNSMRMNNMNNNQNNNNNRRNFDKNNRKNMNRMNLLNNQANILPQLNLLSNTNILQMPNLLQKPPQLNTQNSSQQSTNPVAASTLPFQNFLDMNNKQNSQQNNNNRKQKQPKVFFYKNDRKDCIFIKNLPRNFNNPIKVTDQFRKYGEIKDVQNYPDHQIAFLKFCNSACAEKALRQNGRLFKKNEIVVSLSPDPEEKPIDPSEIKEDSEDEKQSQRKSYGNNNLKRNFNQAGGPPGAGRGRGQQQMHQQQNTFNKRPVNQFNQNTAPVQSSSQSQQQAASSSKVQQKSNPEKELEESKKKILTKLTDKFKTVLGIKSLYSENKDKQTEIMNIAKTIIELKKKVGLLKSKQELDDFKKTNGLASNDYDKTLYTQDLKPEQQSCAFLNGILKENGQIINLKLINHNKQGLIEFQTYEQAQTAISKSKDVMLYFNNFKAYDYLQNVEASTIEQSKQLLRNYISEQQKIKKEEKKN